MILVCGEALYDVFIDQEQGSNLELRAIVGGSPFNVALGLARQSEQCAFASGVSDDQLGRNLISCLTDAGVDISHIVQKSAACSLSIVGIDQVGAPNYTFYGSNAADRILELEDLPANCSKFSIIHVGSYSMVVEPTGSSLLSLIRRETGKRLISYDPNLRTNVEPNINVWQKRLEELLPHINLIKASDEDINLLFPNADFETIANQWLRTGPELVVVTQGENGATAFTKQGKIHCPGRKVEVVDTVGAGDTLQATLLGQIRQFRNSNQNPLSSISNDDLQRILERSVAAAAITCTRKGADMPSINQLEELD